MEIKQFAAGSQVEETKWKLGLVTTICVIPQLLRILMWLQF